MLEEPFKKGGAMTELPDARKKNLDNMRAIMPQLSKHASVNKERLNDFARELSVKEFNVPNWGRPYFPFFPEDSGEFLKHILIGNAVNFCFRQPGHDKFAVRWAPPGEEKQYLEGASGMWAALMRAREEGIVDIYNPYVLSALTEERVGHIFRSDGGPLPLLRERRYNLREIGRNMTDINLGSRFAGFMEEDFRSNFPLAYGGDTQVAVANTGSRKFVPLVFNKRARLFAVMYEGRARSSDLQTLWDPHTIGPVIDYQIPRIFRHLGVLEYSPLLAEKVDNGVHIPRGSWEELAIRVAAYIAVEDILAAVNNARQEPITMVELDYLLWSAGRKAGGRHHLTLTTDY